MQPLSRTVLKLSLLAMAIAVAAPFSIAREARADQPAPQLRFADGRFEPAALDVAAGSPVRLTVINSGSSAVEFESFELNRERVVPPGRSITVLLPRLDPGQYHFFDDFHHDAGQGTITAR
jgi:plastocyanin